MNSLKIVVACAGVVALSTTAACSEPHSKSITNAVATPTKATSDTMPSPIDQAKQAALAAYTGMWTDYANAAQTANYTDQRLTQHATDAALGEMVHSLYQLQRGGLVIKGALETAPTIVDVVPPNTPTQVDIKDCASDVHWLQYVAATGKPRDAIPGGRRMVTARVTKQYDLWRVANYQVQAEGTC
ncbi:hypothetical protein ABH926_007108 [Catenulispora sp. GP43]|uniref:hypothetical protein n=1 Tax=Catenulispora sp. GP43 TaxID=3156263 RepID=UPI003511F8F0